MTAVLAPKISDLLSSRERQVLELLSGGRTDREVGELLGISVGTVRVYRKRVESKLDAKGIVQCMLMAWRLGQIDLDRIADDVIDRRKGLRRGEVASDGVLARG